MRYRHVLCLLAGYWISPAAAQQIPHTNPNPDSSRSMAEVLIPGIRDGQHDDRLPQRITVLGPAERQLQQPQTAADLLGVTGEVFIQKSQQGGGSPMIRGFAANRLLYAVDGVRMNTAIFRSGNLQNVISLDPFAIRQAEVIFGPGSVLYGSDAIGGVMHFQTLTPSYSPDSHIISSGQAHARHASANREQTVHLHVQAGGRRWAMLSSMTHSSFGDLRMGRYGPAEYLRPFSVQRQGGQDVVVANPDPLVQLGSGYSQINLMQKLRFAPARGWDLQYGLHYSATTGYGRYDRLIRTRNGLPRSAEWSYGPQVWMMHQLSLTRRAAAPFYDQLTLRAAYQGFEESRIDRDFRDPERRIREEQVDAWSLNADLSKLLGERALLYYGIEAVGNWVASAGTDEDLETGTSRPGPARYPQAQWASYAAYTMLQLQLGERLTLLGGARYNAFRLDAVFDTTFYPFPYTRTALRNGALTGSLGLTYRAARSWTFRANAATGFRAPNVDDMGKVFDSEPGSVLVPNPDLDAEYAWNVEAGLAKAFGEVLTVELTGYHTLLQHAMVRRGFTLNGADSIFYDGELSQVQAIQNAALARVYGIQAGLELRLPAGFGASSRISLQEGEEELDDGSLSPSRHAAPWFGITRLTWTGDRVAMDLHAVYSGRVLYADLSEESKGTPYLFAEDADGNPWSPGWWTLNFKILCRISDAFAVSGGAENLLDRRYRTYTSGLAAAGRNLVLGLNAQF